MNFLQDGLRSQIKSIVQMLVAAVKYNILVKLCKIIQMFGPYSVMFRFG